MPAPYSTEGLTPQRQRGGSEQQRQKGPVLQSTARPQRGQQQQGQPDEAVQENASRWEQFFGFLRENPEAVAFLATAGQAALDPNNRGDPGAVLRGGFKGIANYRMILQELQQQDEENERAERKLELESSRVDVAEDRAKTERRGLQFEREKHEDTMPLKERELDLLERRYDIERDKLEGKKLTPKDKEDIYSSIFERNLESQRTGIYEELPEGAEDKARIMTNQELIQFRPDLVRYSTDWTEREMVEAGKASVQNGTTSRFAREIGLLHGPQALRVFMRGVREGAQGASRGSNAPDPAQSTAPTRQPSVAPANLSPLNDLVGGSNPY